MKTFIKALVVGVVGFAAIGLTAASARDYRPDRCVVDHDHRTHNANYYDYYAGDRYYSGAYDRRNRNGASFSITFGNGDYYSNSRRYRDRHYNNRRRYDDRRRYDNDDRYDNGYRNNRRRVISRKVLDTRFRARIVVKEIVVRKRHRDRLICTVTPRGPEAEYVPYRRLKRVANNHCSPRARIKIYA